MPRIATELGPLAVKRLSKQGMHAVGGVPGLYLQVGNGQARSWIFRTVVASKRRDIGVGSYPAVSLAAARDKAQQYREMLQLGQDPVDVKKLARRALEAKRALSVRFIDFAKLYLKSHAAGWRNPKHRAQWVSTLESYVYPALGTMTVADIGTPAVLRVLQPIWHTKTETASRVRGRIEAILDAATAQGLREGPNPARWKGHLALILPARSKIAPRQHQKAVPVGEVASFYRKASELQGVGAVALRFLLLTCTRSSETRAAQWDEIDLKRRIWTIPAERMKANREHRVPLSDAVVDILGTLPSRYGLLFPGVKGKPLSDMTLTAVMRRMGMDAVPHGLRSSFRTWAADFTNHPREVCEQCLAHTTGSQVELAYQRSDLFEKRRQVMDEWAAFVQSPDSNSTN
jgi:integrase